MSYEPISKPVCLTTRLQSNSKYLVNVNECFILKDIDKKREYWHCRTLYVIDTRSIALKIFIPLACCKHDLIFLAGIVRNDDVTKRHKKLLEDNKTLFGNTASKDKLYELCTGTTKLSTKTRGKKSGY